MCKCNKPCKCDDSDIIDPRVERYKVGKPLDNNTREFILSEISGKANCPKCKKKVLYIGGDYNHPTLYCLCGFRTFIKLFETNFK